MTTGLTPRVVVDAILSALPARDAHPLHVPLFEGNERAYVDECIDTGWVSSVGKYVDRFEADLAAYTGHARAVAVVNGTAALHLSLLLAGVQPGDEVLVPALTFVATANAVAHAGAVAHFVDSEAGTLGLDPAALDAHLDHVAEHGTDGCTNRETGRAIRAVVPMHAFGHPARMDALADVSARWSLAIVEDCAESLGSFHPGEHRGQTGTHTGHHGLLAALSFNGNKIVTTGGGGAILTNDEELGRRAKHLSTTAKIPHRWEYVHDAVGFNYRLPNLNAALGCAQLERLPLLLERKRAQAARYETALSGIDGVTLFREPEGATSNHWLHTLLLDRDHAHLRDAVLAEGHERGVLLRPAWEPLHRLTMYRDAPRADLRTAEDLHARIINLPSTPLP